MRLQGRRRGWSCILVLTSARTCRLSNRLKDLGQIKLRLLARPPLAPPHRLGRSFPRPNASCRSSLRLNCSSALCCRFLRLGRVYILIRFDLPSGAERLLRWRCCGCGSPAFDAPPLLAVVLTHARSSVRTCEPDRFNGARSKFGLARAFSKCHFAHATGSPDGIQSWTVGLTETLP